jgi:transcriptional regulator with XRE-family HTH domain
MASLGQTLREAREQRNISIEEIASATKIVPRYLEALEDDRLDIMPGEFFIKGIIRTYARAIGLDGEEVLSRYKAAGLIGEPERKRSIFQKAVAEPAPPLPPPPSPAPAQASPAEPGPTPTPKPATAPVPAPGVPEAHGLSFEPVVKPKLSPDARKQIIAWALRIVAVLVVVGVLVILWSSRRPKPARPAPGTIAVPSVVSDMAPSTLPQTDPGAIAPTAPPPAPAAVWKGVTVEFTFNAETWIEVRTDGELKIYGVFPAGTTARARADKEILIQTGNAGGFAFLLNGQPARPLGRTGRMLNDVKITSKNYKSFLAQLP